MFYKHLPRFFLFLFVFGFLSKSFCISILFFILFSIFIIAFSVSILMFIVSLYFFVVFLL